MLIDWITCRISYDHLSSECMQKVLTLGDRILRYNPKTLKKEWEMTAWDSIRSDSHQISVRAGGSDLWIQGSPARVCGDGDAVFGSGASPRLDIPACIDAMRLFIQTATGINIPQDITLWTVSRVDITNNLLLGSHDDVKEALRILRDCEGGRYRVSQQAGDTVYWSHKSKLRSGKAYAKGPHLVYQSRNKSYHGRSYSLDEINLAMPLLRLELKLGREFFARNDWKSLNPDSLENEWNDYFLRMIGGAEMNDENLKMNVIQSAETVRRGKAAYQCWTLIQHEGYQRASQFYSKATWYRHLKILRIAGLSDADLSTGQVVPFRRRVLEARQINSWAELRSIA